MEVLNREFKEMFFRGNSKSESIEIMPTLCTRISQIEVLKREFKE